MKAIEHGIEAERSGDRVCDPARGVETARVPVAPADGVDLAARRAAGQVVTPRRPDPATSALDLGFPRTR